MVKVLKDTPAVPTPGEVKWASIEVERRHAPSGETLPARVAIVDEEMDEHVSATVELPVARDEPALVPSKAAVRIEGSEVLLRSGAAASSPAIATARSGALLSADARSGEFWRVKWREGRFGFAADADVSLAHGPASGQTAEVWQREPPRITITPDPTKAVPSADGNTFRLRGAASLPPSAAGRGKLRDLFVIMEGRKVFFKDARESTDPSIIEFDLELPIQPGGHLVTVVARGDEELQIRRSFVVHRGQSSSD